MTKEEKQILLADLSARLPYGIKVLVEDSNRKQHNLTLKCADIFLLEMVNTPVKPYLRKISSMSDKEIDKLFEILNVDKTGKGDDWIKINDVLGIKFFLPSGRDIADTDKALSYLRSIHIDIQGLIEMGLAIEAPKDMYKIN